MDEDGLMGEDDKKIENRCNYDPNSRCYDRLNV